MSGESSDLVAATCEMASTAASDRWTPYFFRTEDGAEIDLLLARAGRPNIAVEVKRSSAPDTGKGFRLAADALKVQKRFVVYPGEERFLMGGGVTATPLAALAAELGT